MEDVPLIDETKHAAAPMELGVTASAWIFLRLPGDHAGSRKVLAGLPAPQIHAYPGL